MQSVKVLKSDLIAAVQKNKAAHRAEFLEAQEGYREQIVKWLDQALDDARHKRKIVRMIALPEPSDHTSDYERVEAMLGMSVDDTIELSDHEFEQYVMDRWAWTQQFKMTNSTYLAK